MADVVLTKTQLDLMLSGPYYHLKHYDDLQLTDVHAYIAQMKKAHDDAFAFLNTVINIQAEKELKKLDYIFGGELPDIQTLQNTGISLNDATIFHDAYLRGQTASTVEEKVQALNDISHLTLSGRAEASGAKIGEQVAQIIHMAFASNNITHSNVDYTNLDEEYVFISGLVAVLETLKDEQRKAKSQVLYNTLERPILKLAGAIQFYQHDYYTKIARLNHNTTKINQLIKRLDTLVDTKKVKPWTLKHQKEHTFDAVEVTMQRSATGYLNQSGGEKYETAVANHMVAVVHDIFDKTRVNLDITKGKAKTVGRTSDIESKTAQKADILLNFTITTKPKVKEKFYMSFSVKKTGDNTSIQIHHGGSLFAYGTRLEKLGQAVGVDFSFLNEGPFQYTYVNELAKTGDEEASEFFNAVKEMLRNVGWMFLGEEIGKYTGADFLYVQGQIVAFSTVLKAIKNTRGEKDAILVTLSQNRRHPLDKKHELLHKMNDDYLKAKGLQYYSPEFIKESIKIGKDAIYGTTFSINLAKWALK